MKEEDEGDSDDEEKISISSATVKHKGCVNRIRVSNLEFSGYKNVFSIKGLFATIYFFCISALVSILVLVLVLVLVQKLFLLLKLYLITSTENISFSRKNFDVIGNGCYTLTRY